jgi:hypothetical protein
MEVQEQSPRAARMIEAAGLSVTALLLLVIACCLQLAIRLLTRGALQPELGVLAFGFLFYVGAGFVSVGTRQQPDQPAALVANLALSSAFLCVSWFFYRSVVAATWLALALALIALAHGTSYGFARLRRHQIQKLARHRDVIQDAFVERLFRVQSSTFRAIPIGGAVGLVLGAMATRDASTLLRHGAAGVFAAIALDELLRIGASCFAPSPLGAQEGEAAVDISRVLLVNQMQRLTRLAIALLALFLTST